MEIRNKKLKISDFQKYLTNIRDNFQIWQKPLLFQFDPKFQIEQFCRSIFLFLAKFRFA